MMSNVIEGNAVIGQSGGPTAVINQSLMGVVMGLRAHGACRHGHPIPRILGMRHGVRGLIEDDLVDLSEFDHDRLERLAQTPSAGLGSTRDKPDQAYCERILKACKKHGIRYFFYIGGNDSSDTCRIVNELSNKAGYELRCFHVPKTVDNDLVGSDHTPGFPSAARFVALACMADFLDNISLPGIKINVIMGRHAGFLTAASALARRSDRYEGSTDGPQLIYVPEVVFDTERFVQDVAEVFDAKGRCHIAVSEGICDGEGNSIGATLIGGQADAHGNVQLSGSGALGDALSTLLKKKLTPTGGTPVRVRADTFGYVQRCWPDASRVDATEARGVGRFAADLALSGDIDGSVAIERVSPIGGAQSYAAQFKRLDLSAVAAKTRHMPEYFLDGHNNVSEMFIDYCQPLIGRLPTFERL
ncbi:Pyrophosphate-dependent fructose 6-phosphate-1-kinase [hydrothermal vent metagenome]|uniref:Pyrophosphate-dependent fructose 6-phosphate-1-kinase n=1 Tax=hydrothermal vent metagenome TaxID=652676 RepID=A0A3B1E3L5_9ZZZZ